MGLVDHGLSTNASNCQLGVMRSSLPAYDLYQSLKSKLDCEFDLEELIPRVCDKQDEEKQEARGPLQSKIAIVGMACRMPGGADTTEKFWEVLSQGLDLHQKVPPNRFDVDTHCDPTGKRMNTSITPYGCFIEEPGLFDAPFFNISPKEAEQTDPMQRLALVTAYEALERSGYVANRTAATHPTRIGTFYGQAGDDYREVNAGQEVGTYYIPGGCRAFGPGRINYFFKFSGPSYSIDTACSSSLATIQVACSALWSGEVDTAVAGGVNILTNSDAFAGLSNGHFLSKTPNACKTWDSEADGYVRADAIGSVVLKRLVDAEADNDNILGVILSAGTNHSANAISITHPHAGHQTFLGKQILSRAGINPLDINYVEMHGTGTQAGDSEEIQSVTNTYAPLSKRRGPHNPLFIGAVKSNFGHSEAGAGVTALIKVLLMLQKATIPRHVGIKNSLNPSVAKHLDKRNVLIPFENIEWKSAKNKKRLAVINNFSAAGGNSSILIEEAPDRRVYQTDSRPTHVIAVSAKSKKSLKGNLERLLEYLERHPDTSHADLGYSTTARRYHHKYRLAFAATDLGQVKQHLTTALASTDSHQPVLFQGPPEIAFTFTGQGAAYKSSNYELFQSSAYFRSQIMHLDRMSQIHGFPSFIPAIDGSHSKEFQHSQVVTQLAQVCSQIALAKYWVSLGVKPNVVIGHSLGEYAALHIAGVLSASDTVFLVGSRARLLEERCQVGSHKMIAVHASLEQIKIVAGGQNFEIACINSPGDVVLAASKANVDALLSLFQDHGIKCVTLDVAFAFHSAQIDPIIDDFGRLAKSSVVFQEPRLPIISPLLSKVIFDDKTVDSKYVCTATRSTVNFLSALEAAQEIGIIDEKTVWIEIGPHPVTLSFVKFSLTSYNLAVASFRRGESNWTTVAYAMANLHTVGVQLYWNEFHRPYERNLRLLDLPTYAWNDKNYWLQYHGDWALTKGNTFYDEEKKQGIRSTTLSANNPRFITSTVQTIIKESFLKASGTIVMQSDLSQVDFRAAAWGHKMNDCGVVTSSIHADIAYTLGQYLYREFHPQEKDIHMNLVKLHVTKGLVVNRNPDTLQQIQVSITTQNIHSNVAQLEWCNVADDSVFATATIVYGDPKEWLMSWIPATHLVQGRIDHLERLAHAGIANRFSRDMAYLLFARNLVDYADKYRGMQSIVLNELEAFADVTLTTETGGTWTIPPFFIDSVAHLAGFVMNVSNSINTKENYCVTPGWSSMRIAKPLVAGAKYRSYVKMIPTVEDPTVFFGDVYILQDDAIIGLVEGIQFRRYPRILLNRFFAPPDDSSTHIPAVTASARSIVSQPTSSGFTSITDTTITEASAITTPLSSVRSAAPAAPAAQISEALPTNNNDNTQQPDTKASKAIKIIISEARLDIADLTDDANLAELGIDSLLSLVIAEKFREQLGIVVSGSLFLEFSTVGELRSWLEEYHN